jgi:hypothetical protein
MQAKLIIGREKLPSKAIRISGALVFLCTVEEGNFELEG